MTPLLVAIFADSFRPGQASKIALCRTLGTPLLGGYNSHLIAIASSIVPRLARYAVSTMSRTSWWDIIYAGRCAANAAVRLMFAKVLRPWSSRKLSSVRFPGSHMEGFGSITMNSAFISDRFLSRIRPAGDHVAVPKSERE